MAGTIVKGSAAIVSGAIVFTAPQTFEGFSEIGYRITDTNWNIDYLGTVNIFASSGSTVVNAVTPTTNAFTTITGNIGNILKPVTTTTTNTPSIFRKLIYIILAVVLLMGAIFFFSLKKAKWILGIIGLIVIGLGFVVYQFFKKK